MLCYGYVFGNRYRLSSTTVTVRVWPRYEGEGDTERQVYDELWLMLKFIMRFQLQGPGLGLGLGVQNGVHRGKCYGYI